MVIQCKNLISLYILPDQRRVNLLVYNKNVRSFCSFAGFNAYCKVTLRIVDKHGSVMLPLLRKNLYEEGDMLCSKDENTKYSYKDDILFASIAAVRQ